MQPYKSIYDKLVKIIPDLPKHLTEETSFGRSTIGSPSMMDLHYDYLGTDENNGHIIALSHYFEMNGDSVPDPDMEIRVLLETQMAEAISFQNQFTYQAIYEKHEGKQYLRPKLKHELNEYLDYWLTVLIEQGHCIDLSERKKLERENKIEELQKNKTADKERGIGR